MKKLIPVWLSSVILVLAVLLLTVLVSAQTLSEVDTLRAENLKLKAQVLELQRALAQAQLDAGTAALNSERTLLESQFRLVLKPNEGEVFNWQTLKFEPKPPIPPVTNGPPK